MNLKELMSTRPEDLAELQFRELKQHVLNILNKVTNAVDNNDFKTVKEMTFCSPSGDGYGSDNDCIDFNYGTKENIDILNIIGTLEYLLEQSKKKKK